MFVKIRMKDGSEEVFDTDKITLVSKDWGKPIYTIHISENKYVRVDEGIYQALMERLEPVLLIAKEG
ncbi:MAG: hypothetical protein DDT23_00042 [candidate division WS2 bacterium]|nr:hypothetical protein [Candidatus Lithacetigena glycinireducens]